MDKETIIGALAAIMFVFMVMFIVTVPFTTAMLVGSSAEKTCRQKGGEVYAMDLGLVFCCRPGELFDPYRDVEIGNCVPPDAINNPNRHTPLYTYMNGELVEIKR